MFARARTRRETKTLFPDGGRCAVQDTGLPSHPEEGVRVIDRKRLAPVGRLITSNAGIRADIPSIINHLSLSSKIV
jgi:hypothetical protein